MQPAERAEIDHPAVARPGECVIYAVTSGVEDLCKADDLTRCIQGAGLRPEAPGHPDVDVAVRLSREERVLASGGKARTSDLALRVDAGDSGGVRRAAQAQIHDAVRLRTRGISDEGCKESGGDDADGVAFH